MTRRASPATVDHAAQPSTQLPTPVSRSRRDTYAHLIEQRAEPRSRRRADREGPPSRPSGLGGAKSHVLRCTSRVRITCLDAADRPADRPHRAHRKEREKELRGFLWLMWSGSVRRRRGKSLPEPGGRPAAAISDVSCIDRRAKIRKEDDDATEKRGGQGYRSTYLSCTATVQVAWSPNVRVLLLRQGEGCRACRHAPNSDSHMKREWLVP